MLTLRRGDRVDANAALGEDAQGERLLSLRDEGNYRGDVPVLEHGPHRAEYFLSERLGIFRQLWNS